MGKAGIYHYFVEGEDEEKIIKVLKTDLQVIVPGKIQKFNVTMQKMTKLRLMSLKMGTVVILVFDTDAGNAEILKRNIDFLKGEPVVKDVICVTQVENLEDELKRSCNIRQIRELTGSKSNSDFKSDMIKDSTFHKKLLKHKFEIQKFWNQSAKGVYAEIRNDAEKIKILKGKS